MEWILMLALFAPEILLAVMSMKKGGDKKLWLRDRLFIRAGQTGIFLGALVLPGIDLGFRFAVCFAVLLLRLAVALIGYFRRGKASGQKKKAALIMAALLGILIIGFSLVPAFLFSDYQGLETTGPYGVKHASAILIDESRTDPFENDGSFREVPVYFYYPDGDTAPADAYPLVVFSHGAFGFYESNYSTYAQLASHGYVVVSMDHPHHSFFTQDTQGNSIIVDMGFMNDVMRCSNEPVDEEEKYHITKEWFDLRTGDMNFVVDTLKSTKSAQSFSGAWFVSSEDTQKEILGILAAMDTEKIGLMGHSIGGASSVTLGRTRTDIDAVANLDGTLLGEHLGFENGEYILYTDAYPIPILAINSEPHHQDISAQGERYVNAAVMAGALYPHYTYFAGSGHMNYTDLPLLSPALASMLGTGSVDAQTCVETMNAILLQYFDHYLKGKGDLNILPCY